MRPQAGAMTVAEQGLTETEAAARLAAAPRRASAASSRSLRSIVLANTFTVFNAILTVAGAFTLAFGDWRDALFLGILIANTSIGIAQELRAKRALDRLAALVAPTAVVVRDGSARTIGVEDVVPGDLVRLEAGDGIVGDGRLVEATELLVDESVLTGESEPVGRGAGDPVRSGSFAVDGSGAFVVEAVGADSYAGRLSGEARTFRHPRSPLELALNRLLIVLVAVMVPLALALGTALALRSRPLHEAVATAVAGVVSLVPEGLLLLSGLTMAVAALRMARRGVLAQQLNAVESLASVDVVCTDKTGTLTERTLRLLDVVPAPGCDEAELREALGGYAGSWPARDETLDALASALPAAPPAPGAVVPFSSDRRWGAIEAGGRALVLGAPEAFSLGSLSEQARDATARGRRVLALGRASALPETRSDRLGDGVAVLGLAVLAERLRPNAAATIAFLRSEGVAVKVLSGDSPATVAAIARDVGVAGDVHAVDGRTLPEDPEQLRRVALSANVIGRISPDGKRRVVEALRDTGAYVAMIGDGVNDVPALKAARLAIAQGSGTQMARAVADLVLVQGDFGVVPRLVAEGRQVLRNVARVTRLFVTKSVFAAAIILTLGLAALPYPFLPRHLSLASSLTIGVPGFLLALAPSSGRWRPESFLRDVARFAVPAGLAAAAAVAGAYLASRHLAGMPTLPARTAATTALVLVGLFLVIELESGSARRGLLATGLAAALLGVYVLALAVGPVRRFYELAPLTAKLALVSGAAAALGIALAAAGLRRLDNPGAMTRTRRGRHPG